MPKRCAVPGCPTIGLDLHCFPNPNKFLERFKTWVNIIGGRLESESDYEFYRRKKICGKHFIEKYYNRNNRFNALAIPSLYLHELKNSPPALLLKELRCKRKEIYNLKKNVNKLRETGKTFKSRLANAEKINNDDAFKKVTKNMPKPAVLFTYMQLRQSAKKPPGRRFSIEEKILSLSLYKKSPRSYSLLSKYFVLPSAVYEKTFS